MGSVTKEAVRIAEGPAPRPCWPPDPLGYKMQLLTCVTGHPAPPTLGGHPSVTGCLPEDDSISPVWPCIPAPAFSSRVAEGVLPKGTHTHTHTHIPASGGHCTAAS